jgi:hypothetical protein
LEEIAKGLLATTNFLEGFLDDEEATMVELNHVCREDQHIFSRVRIPKRKLPIAANPTEEQEEVIAINKQKVANMGSEASVKFKIFFHSIKGNITLTPMETILIILGELEYLEGLVKLTRRRKDVEGQRNQIIAIHSTPTIRKVSVNKTHYSKTLHLVVEINQTMI